nr:DUF624 domain-containing protein [Fictibacillus phosphorivorans]
MEWIWKLVYLNIVWILFSLPLITLIPATFVMFSIVNKWLTEDQDPNLFSTFIREFKSYFWKSYPLGIVLIVLGAFLTADLLILKDLHSTYWLTVRYALIVVMFFFLVTASYSIPIYIHYGLSWYKTLFVSFMIGLRQPLTTFLMLCGILLVVMLVLFATGIGICVMGSLIALITSKAAKIGINKI